MGMKVGKPAETWPDIDRDSPFPFYVQVRKTLEAQIEQEHWNPGDQIPGEPELCRLFGVSRPVIRQALKEMELEGLIVRKKGLGTFISSPKIVSKSLVHSLSGFHEDMVEHGLKPVADVLEQEIRPASKKIAQMLAVEEMTPVTKITRLRYVEDEPVAIVTSYLPYEICRNLINADLTHQSLYAYLETECGLSIASGWRRIDAVVAGEERAAILKIDPGAPLLQLESVSYSAEGIATEYFLALFRSDKTSFEVEIDRINAAEQRADMS